MAMIFFIVNLVSSDNAYAADSVDSDNLTFTIPTKIPFKIKANGDIIAPDNWNITVAENTGFYAIEDISATGIPDGIGLSAESEHMSTFSHALTHDDNGYCQYGYKNGTSTFKTIGGTEDDPLCWGYGPDRQGSKYIKWSLTGLDKKQDLIDKAADNETSIGNISIKLKSIHKTAFAIYSDNDKSLDMYNRIRIPQNGEQYEGKTATAVYTGFDEYFGYVKQGEDLNTGRTNLPWDEHREDILSVKVIDTIKPKSIDYWFQWFDKCETMDLKKIDTSRITLMAHTFRSCHALTSLDLSTWDLSYVGSFDGPFSDCYNLADIIKGTWRIKPSSLYGLFSNCQLLSQSAVQAWVNSIDTSNCWDFICAFNNMKNIKYLDLSSWKAPKATCMMSMFRDSTNLEILDISQFDTSNIGNGLDASGTVKGSLDNMFWNTPRLRVVKLGSKFAWDNSTDSEYRFGTPSSDYIDGADGKWYAASDGTSYTSLTVPSNKADTYYAVKPMAFAIYSKTDKSLNFYNRAGRPVVGDSEWIDDKTVDGVYSGFEDKTYRTTSSTNNDLDTMTTPWADIHNDVLSVSVIDNGIKPISIAFWFQFFRNCKSFDLNKLDTSKCTSIQHTFAYCYAATDIKVNEWNTNNITEFDSVFKYMHALESIDLSRWNTSSCSNMHEMFTADRELSNVNLGDAWDTLHVTDFIEMFQGCYQLILDCSDWNVSNTNYHVFSDSSMVPGTTGNSHFNDGAPGVIKPKPWQETAFAIYSADDNSFAFYKRERRLIPASGSSFNDKTVSSVYTGFEENNYIFTNSSGEYSTWTTDCPWFDIKDKVESVNVIDTIKPLSMAVWFFRFNNCTYMNLSKIDTSKCSSLYYTFSSCHSLIDSNFIGLDKWNTFNIKYLDAAFNGTYLKSFNVISNWDTSNVVSFMDVFYNCVYAENIDISGWSDKSAGQSQVLFDSNAEDKFKNLKSIKIGSNWSHPEYIFNNSLNMLIPLEDDKWYALSDGSSYNPAAIPSCKADTYYITKSLRDEAAKSSK